jgi:magnesium-transporting ATPase (P-type)
MNSYMLAAGIVGTVGFFIHIVWGTLESLSTSPARLNFAPSSATQTRWMQLMCAFQVLSIDLAASAALAFFLALTPWLEPRPLLAYMLSGWNALRALAWLVQLLALRRPLGDYARLPQWVFFSACCVLCYLGARQLAMP